MSRDKTTIETLKACREFILKANKVFGLSGQDEMLLADLDALIARGDDLPDVYPCAWMVERDTDYDSRELFLTQKAANENAQFGVVDSHVYPLYSHAAVESLRSHAQALAARLAGLEQGE